MNLEGRLKGRSLLLCIVHRRTSSGLACYGENQHHQRRSDRHCHLTRHPITATGMSSLPDCFVNINYDAQIMMAGYRDELNFIFRITSQLSTQSENVQRTRILKVAKTPNFRNSQITKNCLIVGMKRLSSLLADLQAVCAAFPDPGRGAAAISPWLISGCRPSSCFHAELVFPVLPAPLEKGEGRSNCQSLFGVEKIPSDNYIREILDEASPALLAPCFEPLESLLAEPPLPQPSSSRASVERYNRGTIQRGHISQRSWPETSRL